MYVDALFVPFQKRNACEFLVQSICARITALLQLARSVAAERSMNFQISICEKMMSCLPTERFRGLVGAGANMCSCIPYSEGAAVVLPSAMYTHGKVPSEELIRRILSMVITKNQKSNAKDTLPAIAGTSHVAATSHESIVGVECMSQVLPNTQGLAHLVAGILSVPIANSAGYLLWFRPEFRNTVTYAGAPPNDAEITQMGPRASFAAFDQMNKLCCRPWTETDKVAALSLSELVSNVCGPATSANTNDVSDALVRLNAERTRTRGDCLTMASDLSRLLDIANAPIFAVDVHW